jgi:thiamine biosynthesis lipoprotein ApbE
MLPAFPPNAMPGAAPSQTADVRNRAIATSHMTRTYFVERGADDVTE